MTRSNRDDSAVKSLVRRHWNGRAATFDEEAHHGIHSERQYERWLAVLREWTGDARRVLDVGCGTGVVSLLLSDLDHSVAGVDVAPAMLDRAREKARRTDRPVEFLRGDAETLPLPDDAFERVVARHLLWTLPNPTAAIREWRRVVEPGGRIVLIEGHWDHDEPWDEYEAIHDALPMYDGRPPGELSEVLARAGLSRVRSAPLRDSTLWGREPQHDYYVTSGRVPR